MLSRRFEAACAYALKLHATQSRKGSGTPYVAHLLAVAALVLEDGGDEDVAIAALLHDAIEDQGGRATQAKIRRKFGNRVEAIVVGCSDPFESPKGPWRERKESFIASLGDAPTEVLQVVAADKLHNARSVIHDYVEKSEAIWQRFKGGKEGSLWYYRAIADVLVHRLPNNAMVRELVETVDRLHRLQENS